tara:strand:- start:5600 stop:6616 length:1017 start_codon:yes stop_codon:yes gene_type:complete
VSNNPKRTKIIIATFEHYLSDYQNKLLISDVCSLAEFSRQSFHRYHKDLKAYVEGKKPIGELFSEGKESIGELLREESLSIVNAITVAQQTIMSLKNRLDCIENVHDKELEKLEFKFITTLMNNDITYNNTDEIRLTLEKQALHNQKLLTENNSLSNELTLLKSREFSGSMKENSNESVEIIDIDPTFDPVYKDFTATGDIDNFEDQKDKTLESTLKRVNKFTQSNDTEVILFIDRFISDFKKFVGTFTTNSTKPQVIVRLPLFSKLELKMFIRKIKPVRPVSVYIPYTDSEAVRAAQRKFMYRNVPEYELTNADKYIIPNVTDGFEKLVVFKVFQGD